MLGNLSDNLLVFVMSALIRLKRKTEMSMPLNDGIEDFLMLLILIVIPLFYVGIATYLLKNYKSFNDPYSNASLKFGE